jgi:hypothetical protein
VNTVVILGLQWKAENLLVNASVITVGRLCFIEFIIIIIIIIRLRQGIYNYLKQTMLLDYAMLHLSCGYNIWYM